MEPKLTPQHQPTIIQIEVPSANSIARSRPLIPTFFALAIVFFFFSFCEFQCNGQKVIPSVTGIEFVHGKHLKSLDVFGDAAKDKTIPSNWCAIIALGAAVVGLGVFLIKEKRELVIGIASGAVGTGALIALQVTIKRALEEKGEGQMEAVFQFGYWGALASLALAGIISYIRLVKINNGSLLQPAVALSQEPAPMVYDNPTTVPPSFDLIRWLARNQLMVAGLILVLGTLAGVYYFVWMPDPVRDAKRAFAASCDCTARYNDDLIKSEQDFSKAFDTYGFKRRKEADSRRQQLSSTAKADESKCRDRAKQKHDDLQLRYAMVQEQLEKFDYAYNAVAGKCFPANQDKLTRAIAEVDAKVKAIKDPQPDLEKIKVDLIGKKVMGWFFDNLSEIKHAAISNTSVGNDSVKYRIDMDVEGSTNHNQHQMQVEVTYVNVNDGWEMSTVKANFITANYVLPVGHWQMIDIMQGCRFDVICEGKYWIQDGQFAEKRMAGGDAPKVATVSSTVYVSSREATPIKLTIKYFPL